MLKYFKADLAGEFPIRERCMVAELLGDDAVPDMSIARCRVEPGVTTELHSLKNVREIYVVLSGTGITGDGRAPGQRIDPFDCVLIPAGHPQKVLNDGTKDLIFIAICTDRFVPECYIPNEGDGAVDPVYPETPDEPNSQE